MFRYKCFGWYWRRKLGLPRNYEPWFARHQDSGRVRPASNTIRIASIAEVSLNMPTESGSTLGELLRDDSWSDWLEEMGVTWY
jgi:hypothetical protein